MKSRIYRFGQTVVGGMLRARIETRLLAIGALMLASACPASAAQEEPGFNTSWVSIPAAGQVDRLAIPLPGNINIDISPPRFDENGKSLIFPTNDASHLFGQTSPAAKLPQWTPRFDYTKYPVSAFNHRPLYFEDANLERYGRTHGAAQIVFSGARFYSSIIALPYKMALEPAQSCVSNDRYWVPPSECGPRFVQRPPANVRAGLWQAGAVLGLVFLIP